MFEYIKNNLIAFLALLISILGFMLSYKNYLKSIVKLKLSYDVNNSFSLGFIWYNTYKLIIIDLTIENNSTSNVDISKIRLVDKEKTYLATKIEIADQYNKNGISLVKQVENIDKSYQPINITTENILNNSRVSSYGTLNGFAVFQDIEPLKKPKTFKLVIDTPAKSFKKLVTINPHTGDYNPIHQL